MLLVVLRYVCISRAFTIHTLIKPTNFFVVFMLGWSTVSFSEAIEIKINLSEKVMSLIALIKTKFYAESVILLSVLITLPSLQVKNVWNYRGFFTQTVPYLGKYFHALFKNRARQYIYGKLAVLSPCFKPQGWVDLKVLLSSKFKAEHSWENVPLLPSSPPTHVFYSCPGNVFSSKNYFCSKKINNPGVSSPFTSLYLNWEGQKCFH